MARRRWLSRRVLTLSAVLGMFLAMVVVPAAAGPGGGLEVFTEPDDFATAAMRLGDPSVVDFDDIDASPVNNSINGRDPLLGDHYADQGFTFSSPNAFPLYVAPGGLFWNESNSLSVARFPFEGDEPPVNYLNHDDLDVVLGPNCAAVGFTLVDNASYRPTEYVEFLDAAGSSITREPLPFDNEPFRAFIGIVSPHRPVAAISISEDADDGDDIAYDQFVCYPGTIQVAIDIKPGSHRNSLNIDGHGVIPVAILGSDSIDVTQIDTGTLDFAGLAVKANKKGKVQCSLEDVSGDFITPEGAPDGYLDLLCQFVDDLERWSPDNGTATLTGALLPEFGATPFFGSDEYRLVPVGRSSAPLVVWTYPEYAAGLIDAAEQFTTDTGIDVAVEVVDISEMFARISEAAESEQGPDVFVGPHDWAGRLVEGDLVEPIDLTSVTSEFEPVATQAFLYAGAHWGLPIAVEATALFYNADLVAAPPATFETLGPSCASMIGIENCVGLMRPDAYFHYPFLTAFGGYVFGFDPAAGYDPSDVGLDSPSAIAGAQFLEAQVQAGAIGPIGEYDLIRDLFLSGVQPYWITGPWELDALMASGLDWDVAPIPTMSGNVPGPFVGVHGFFRGAYGEQEADAVFLLEYVATAEAMIALFNSGAHRPPAHLEAYNAVADEVTEVIMQSVAVGEPMPNIPEMHYAWFAMADAFDAIRLGTIPADEAMIQAAQAVRDAIGS